MTELKFQTLFTQKVAMHNYVAYLSSIQSKKH